MYILTLDIFTQALSPIRFFDGLFDDNDEADELIDKAQEEFDKGNTEEAEADMLEGMAKKLREAAERKRQED